MGRMLMMSRTHRVADPGFVIVGIDGLAEQAGKRQKVTPPPEPEPEPEPELERGPGPTEADTWVHDEVVLPSNEMEVEIEPEPAPEPAPEDESLVNDVGSAEEDLEDNSKEEEEVQPVRKPPRVSKKPSSQPPVSEGDTVITAIKRPLRQKSQGKKPPSPKVTVEEEREAEEAERVALLRAQQEREAWAKTEALAKRRAKAKADALAAVEAEKQTRVKARAKAKGRGRVVTARPQPEPDPDTGLESEAEELDDEPRAIEEEDYQETPPPPPQHKKKRKPAGQEQAQDDDEAAGDDAAPRRRRREPGIEVRVWRYDKGDQPLPPGSNRKGVNHIDIAYSLFVELIDNHFGTLQRTTEKTAIENFKEELCAKMMVYVCSQPHAWNVTS
jgi:hypothetical protein